MSRLVAAWRPVVNEDKWNMLAAMTTNYVMLGFQPEDVSSIEWGAHITNNQIVYKVVLLDGAEFIIYESSDGTRYSMEGSPS